MLKELLKNRKFKGIVGKGLKHESVLDIFLFGSVVRGKEEPGDIDLLIIYVSKVDVEHSYELRKNLERGGFKVHVVSELYEKLFNSNFLARESILLEGYSLRKGDFLFSAFGFSSMVFFRYYLKGKSSSERMRFYYSLYGRGDEKGILDKFNAWKFSDRIIVCSVKDVEDVRGFLEKWGLRFDEFSVLLPARVAGKKFLELK